MKTSNADILFGPKTLMWKFYTTNKALPTTKQVQIINPNKFVIAALDINNKTFVMYMAIQKQEKVLMYSKKQAQVRVLLFDKASTKILIKYSNYSNVFLVENIVESPKNTGMNEHDIKLEKDK